MSRKNGIAYFHKLGKVGSGKAEGVQEDFLNPQRLRNVIENCETKCEIREIEMKGKCRKAYESILSKGRATVILAVCMAIAIFALTACGGEQTGPAGSSEDAGMGNLADSDAVPSGVDVADRESEEFPKEKGGAELPQPYAGYMEILEQIMTEGHDSNGREYYWNEPRNFENNCFAILDVDNDGRQELLFNFNESYMGDMCEVVYEYDEETDILREELTTWVSTDYYSNGMVKVDASHNHGKDPEGRGIWPYMVYQYDEERDSYQLLYSVDSWDGHVNEEDFPDELDMNGDKLLYCVMVEEAGAKGNISGNMSAEVSESIQEDTSAGSSGMIIFDWEEYSAWAEKLMPEWSRIHVSYHRMTEDFMERVQGAYVQAASYAAQADEWFVGEETGFVSGVSGDYLLYDLDGDGGLELTVSVMQGTGRYSDNHFYDLNDNGKVTELELVKLCDSKEWEWTGDFDIGGRTRVQAYQDDNSIIYYEGHDYCREGIYGGYDETGFYYLKDGVVYQDSILRRTEIFHEENGQEDEIYYYSISLDEGGAAIDEKEVTKEQYEAIREKYIREMAESRVYQNWTYFWWDEITQGEISEEVICRRLFESAIGSE